MRILITRILAREDGCYAGNLGRELDIAPSTLSQHLKVLVHSGLIKGCSEPPRIKYCIERTRWEEAKRLMGEFYSAVDERKDTGNRRTAKT